MEFSVYEDPWSVENVSTDILDGRQRRVEPTLDGLRKEYGLESGMEEGFLKQIVTKNLEYCREESNVYDNVLWPGIEVIYKFFAVSKNEKNIWSEDLNSFDSFWKKYGAGFNGEAKKNFRGRIKLFCEAMLNPQRIIEVRGVSSRSWNCPVYNWKGEWVRYNDESEGIGRYVEKGILTEIDDLLTNNKTWRADYFHVSGSAALGQIESDGKILSAREQELAGIRPVTGEYCDRLDENGEPMLVGGKGLGNVFVSEDAPSFLGYSTVNWFDEHIVAFGVNKEKLKAYFDTQGWELHDYESYPGDGLPIGQEIPLNCVDMVYGNSVDRGKIEEWMKKAAPEARFVSREAFELLNSYYTTGKNIEEKKNWLRKQQTKKVVTL